MRRVVIAQHHKCATQLTRLWLEALCAENDLTLFHSHISRQPPSPTHDISILTNSTFQTLASEPDAGFLHIIRNPLSIVVSAYFSHLHSHPDEYWPKLREQRALLAGLSKDDGLRATLRFLESDEFGWNTVGPLHSLGKWKFDDQRFEDFRMEDFGDEIGARLGPTIERLLARRLTMPDPQPFRFAALSQGRTTGEVSEKSHYRDGSVDGWKRHLPADVIAEIRERYGPSLARYYPDLSPDQISRPCSRL